MILVRNSFQQSHTKWSSVIPLDIEQSLTSNFNVKPEFQKSPNWIVNEQLPNKIIVEDKEKIKPKKKFKSKQEQKKHSQNFEAFSSSSKSRVGSLIEQIKHPIQVQKKKEYIKLQMQKWMQQSKVFLCQAQQAMSKRLAVKEKIFQMFKQKV